MHKTICPSASVLWNHNSSEAVNFAVHVADRSTRKSWANISSEIPANNSIAHEIDSDSERDPLPALSPSVLAVDGTSGNGSRNVS